MKSNITKILIKKFWKRCVTLPWIAHMRYGPPLLVLTFTDDPLLRGPSPPPSRKNVPSLIKSYWNTCRHFLENRFINSFFNELKHKTKTPEGAEYCIPKQYRMKVLFSSLRTGSGGYYARHIFSDLQSLQAQLLNAVQAFICFTLLFLPKFGTLPIHLGLAAISFTLQWILWPFHTLKWRFSLPFSILGA